MGQHEAVTNLEQLLDCLAEAAEKNRNGKVSIATIMEMIGHRSFGPLLLLAGLVILAPVIGDIPGVPTIMAFFVLLMAIQLLLGQQHFWLPNWLQERAIDSDKLSKAIDWLRKPARFIDKLIQPRLLILVSGKAKYAIASAAIMIALLLPFMEVIPFSANAAGIALLAFGLALIARDGVLALLSFVVTALTVGFIGTSLL
ncbi:exopolysaccharide synthesis, ExoD [Methylophaga frappieri]|uniref:Exopolysaccharide synthesis, ExoD n=1 Tax=Methylophaga frappieri (strain ATCC BAA-2434 / DSM 25690 / JAM7) TaxID=754477 RepID=I1YJF3_METFJ|nr:exopolysaccharide biosynthesis protein [Methylophaga frappieri]AFJ03046.1 exopolysaccharide synthesis, ExoD [Methylophaga frappieri]